MARRVNTKFVTALLITVMGLGAALFIATKFLIKDHAEPYVAAGEQALKDRKWSDAVTDFSRAAKLSPSNAMIQVRLGKAWSMQVQTDPDASTQEGAALSRAIEIDPNCLPGLAALGQWETDQGQRYAAGGSPAYLAQAGDYYTKGIEYFRRALALAPNDQALAAEPAKLTVQKWIAGLDTDQHDVDQAVKDLVVLSQKAPADADLPFTYARAKLEQGVRQGRNNPQQQSAQATALFKASVELFEKVLSGPNGGTQDHNALMHYDYAVVLEMLSAFDHSTTDNGKMYRERASAQMARAQDLASQQDPNYFQINEGAANMALRRGDRAAAIKIYKSLPDSVMKTLDLAPVLGIAPETRPEGEKMVQNQLAGLRDDPTHLVFGAPRFNLLLTLVNLQVDDFIECKEAAARQKLHEQIASTLHRLDTVVLRDWLPLVEAETRFQVASGDAEEETAINTLSRILGGRTTNLGSPLIQRMNFVFAEALFQTHQWARAVPVLTLLVRQQPKNLLLLKHLIEAMLQSSTDQVPQYLTMLEKLAPANDADLLRFHIELLKGDLTKNKDQIKKYYDGLPESTRKEKAVKAQIAFFDLGDTAETRRLLEDVIQDDPNKDPANFVLLARVLNFAGDKDKALEVVNKGLKLYPDNPELKLLIPQIKGEDPKLIEQMEDEIDQHNPDKMTGELNMAARAGQRGDVDAQEKHLKNAEQAAPQSAVVWDKLFDFYVANSRFDDAAAYIPKLAGANYDSAGGEMYRLHLAEARGDIGDAEDIARKLAQEKPDFPPALLAFGDVLFAQRQYQEAIDQYSFCLQKQSNMAPAYVGMIRCYYALKQNDAALHVIEQGLSKLPNDTQLRGLNLMWELNYGDPHKAIDELKQEIQADPDHRPDLYAAMADVALRYAEMLRASGDKDAAVKQAQEAANSAAAALGKWPDDATLFNALTEAQIATGDLAAAQKTLLQWADRPAWHLKPDPYVALANFYETIGQPDAAEAQMQTAVARSGYRLDLLLDRANMLNRHKKYDQALLQLRAAGGDKPAVRTKIVQTLLLAGRFDDAQAALNADMAGNPSDAENLLTLWAAALLDHKDFAGTIDRATAALAINPKNPNAVYYRGRAELQLPTPQPAKALQDLALVRQSKPNDPTVRLYIAQADLMLNRLDDAAGELEAGLRAEPLNLPVRMMLVDVYMRQRHSRLPEALDLLQQVDATSPYNKDPKVFQTEAILLEQLHQADQAVGKIRTAASLAPDDPVVQRAYLQLLLETRNFQAVMDQTAALGEKLKHGAWCLWARASAEKELGNAAALPDLKVALAAAQTQQDDIEFDRIATAIGADFGIDEAIADVTPFSASDKYVTAQLTLARLVQEKGDGPRAFALVESLMSHLDKMNPTDQFNTLHSAAMMYQSADPPMVDKAYNAYQRWLQLNPHDPEALNNLACLLADDYTPTRAKEALPYGQRALAELTKLGQSRPGAIDTQAWLLILTGSPDQGVDMLSHAIQDYPPFPEEYLHRGQGYLLMKMPAQAKADANLALDLLNKVKQPSARNDAILRSKLQDLINRSEEMMRTKK